METVKMWGGRKKGKTFTRGLEKSGGEKSKCWSHSRVRLVATP